MYDEILSKQVSYLSDLEELHVKIHFIFIVTVKMIKIITGDRAIAKRNKCTFPLVCDRKNQEQFNIV